MLMIEIDLEVCFDPSKTAPTALGRINTLIKIDFIELLDSLKTADTTLSINIIQPARARRACALRALGLLLADGAPTVGRGKTF